jgi:hypothetical protein
VCSKSSPASTPEVLISYTQLNANNFQSNTLSNTVHASLHRALRSLKPIDLTSLNETSGVDAGDDFEHTILKCTDHLFDNQQLGEYKSLTPTYLLKQDTSQLPDIDVSTVKKYLLNRKAQEFTF